MKFIVTTIAAAAAFLPMIEGHVSMSEMPGYYPGGDGLAPLEFDGSNFPCTTTDFTKPNGDGPILKPGDQGEITLHGSATHGGGSCQISITYDQPPNPNSVWKVLRSFQGSCPRKGEGNLAANPANPLPKLFYDVPKGLHDGAATIAW